MRLERADAAIVVGLAIARALRSRSSKSLLVALTGYSQPDHERRAEEADFHAHIVKPASFEQLYEIISGASRKDSCR